MKNYFIIISLLLYCSAGMATVCKVQSGKVKIGENIYRAPALVENCKGCVKSISSSSELCFFNKSKQWRCEKITKDSKISVSNLVVGAEYKESFASTMMSIFNPAETKSYGGLRLKDTEYLAGFPYGEILMPKATLSLNVQIATQNSNQEFVLMDASSSKVIFETNKPVAKVLIPSAILKPEGEYRWILKSAGETYPGSFSITAKIHQQVFEEDFKSAQVPGLGPVATQALRATIAKEYGYTFDSQQLVQAVTERVNSQKVYGGAL